MVAACNPSEAAISWPSSGGGVTFDVREATYSVSESGTYEFIPNAAACEPDEQVINGGMYWDAIDSHFLTGDRVPGGT